MLDPLVYEIGIDPGEHYPLNNSQLATLIQQAQEVLCVGLLARCRVLL